MPHKQFEIPPTPPEAKTDPITFNLGEHKFTCVDEVPIGVRLRLGEGRLRQVDLSMFISGVVLESETWEQLMLQKEPVIPQPLVEELFWWLINEYAERTGQQLAQPLEESEVAAASNGTGG